MHSFRCGSEEAAVIQKLNNSVKKRSFNSFQNEHRIIKIFGESRNEPSKQKKMLEFHQYSDILI